MCNHIIPIDIIEYIFKYVINNDNIKYIVNINKDFIKLLSEFLYRDYHVIKLSEISNKLNYIILIIDKLILPDISYIYYIPTKFNRLYICKKFTLIEYLLWNISPHTSINNILENMYKHKINIHQYIQQNFIENELKYFIDFNMYDLPNTNIDLEYINILENNIEIQNLLEKFIKYSTTRPINIIL